MKQFLYVLLFSFVLVACNNKPASETKSETKEVNESKDATLTKDDENKEMEVTTTSEGWTASQKTQFVNDCVTAAMAGMDKAKATSYCECMLVKMEDKYDTFNEANQITEAELNSEEWLKEVRKCLGQN